VEPEPDEAALRRIEDLGAPVGAGLGSEAGHDAHKVNERSFCQVANFVWLRCGGKINGLRQVTVTYLTH
jgi:hypothetical protein